MATPEQFAAAFSASDGHIKVASRSGKEYWLHEDQLRGIEQGGLCYGVPVNKHPRGKRDIYWLRPKNVEIVEKEPSQ